MPGYNGSQANKKKKKTSEEIEEGFMGNDISMKLNIIIVLLFIILGLTMYKTYKK